MICSAHVLNYHSYGSAKNRLVAHLGAARIPVLFFRDVHFAVRERNEFGGGGLVLFAETHSTVKVSWQVIVAMAPGLVVPFVGGVLIDRFDRRYLGVILDFARGLAVLGTA